MKFKKKYIFLQGLTPTELTDYLFPVERDQGNTKGEETFSTV
jgi:hypothetical protein